VEITWFRNPYDGYAGTLNLCFNALDRHVIRGRATEPAVIGGDRSLDFAGLLEQVSALAGVLTALGVGPGASVVERLDDRLDRVLFVLAVSRVGAVLDGPEPLLLATCRQDDDGAPVRLLRGVPVRDGTRDLDWDQALKAGRADPAACVELRGDAPAFVVDGSVVAVSEALDHAGWPARVHAMLAGGGPLDVRSDLA
jgi:hypothetical protein